MNTEQRKTLVESLISDPAKFHQRTQQSHLNATLQERDPFNSETYYTSINPREITAVFMAGEKNTPHERAFDLFLPRDIKSGVYPLNSLNQLIQIALSEFFPHHSFNLAYEGLMDLSVNADKREYSGSFNVKFFDDQHQPFASEGTFSFVLEN